MPWKMGKPLKITSLHEDAMTLTLEKNRRIYLIDTTPAGRRTGSGSGVLPFSSASVSPICFPRQEYGNWRWAIPAMGSEECRVMSEIVKLDLSLRLTAWCRARREDIDLACNTGGEECSHLIPGFHPCTCV